MYKIVTLTNPNDFPLFMTITILIENNNFVQRKKNKKRIRSSKKG